jgi:hypothetical protein
LAAIFAVEAKLAWYSPDSNARVEISAAKLRADEAPKLSADVLTFAAPLPDRLPQIELILAFATLVLTVGFRHNVDAYREQAPNAPGSFPPLFLRPPPRR